MPAFWTTLFDILVLFAVALALGAIAERLKQSAILGYLLAGTLLGPNAFDLISESTEVDQLAELGVALLLFTIGLEFSWKRLRKMGRVAFAGGSMQIGLTLFLFGAGALVAGTGLKPAIAFGCMVALSSTAYVLRVLISRAEVESLHGRNALAILLVQDLAVIPLVLIVSLMGGEEGSVVQVLLDTLQTLGVAVLLVATFYVLFNYVVPRLLLSDALSQNRDLPILLAVVVGLGSAWAAHKVNLSAPMGAFVAGMLLAESPFATQIRADVGSLRTILMTLFFSSIGMVGDPMWIMQNWLLVGSGVGVIVIGKAVIIWFVLVLVKQRPRVSLQTGLCLAQVGEFSFVLAGVARAGNVIGDDLFRLVVSVTIATLFLTPYQIALAPRIAGRVIDLLEGRGWVKRQADAIDTGPEALEDHIIVIGYGPAGQAIVETLHDRQEKVHVVDLNPKSIAMARRAGLHGHIGDATQEEMLSHLGVANAMALVITIPDPAAVRSVIHMARTISPTLRIYARARYHVYRWELEFAGADVVIDEEQHVGARLAQALHGDCFGKDAPLPPPEEA